MTPSGNDLHVEEEGDDGELDELFGAVAFDDLPPALVDETFEAIHPTGWHRLADRLDNPTRSYLPSTGDGDLGPVIETVGKTRWSET